MDTFLIVLILILIGLIVYLRLDNFKSLFKSKFGENKPKPVRVHKNPFM